MDIEYNDANRDQESNENNEIQSDIAMERGYGRPKRVRRRPQGLLTAPQLLRSQSSRKTAKMCRTTVLTKKVERNDDIERKFRKFRSIAAVQHHISNISKQFPDDEKRRNREIESFPSQRKTGAIALSLDDRKNNKIHRRNNVKPNDDLERKARAIAAVQHHVLNINTINPPIYQSHSRESIYVFLPNERGRKRPVVAGQRKAGAIKAVRKHIPSLGDKIRDEELT
jgi:hypothetical protein